LTTDDDGGGSSNSGGGGDEDDNDDDDDQYAGSIDDGAGAAETAAFEAYLQRFGGGLRQGQRCSTPPLPPRAKDTATANFLRSFFGSTPPPLSPPMDAADFLSRSRPSIEASCPVLGARPTAALPTKASSPPPAASGKCLARTAVPEAAPTKALPFFSTATSMEPSAGSMAPSNASGQAAPQCRVPALLPWPQALMRPLPEEWPEEWAAGPIQPVTQIAQLMAWRFPPFQPAPAAPALHPFPFPHMAPGAGLAGHLLASFSRDFKPHHHVNNGTFAMDSHGGGGGRPALGRGGSGGAEKGLPLLAAKPPLYQPQPPQRFRVTGTTCTCCARSKVSTHIDTPRTYILVGMFGYLFGDVRSVIIVFPP
jgi:hypothetical protein